MARALRSHWRRLTAASIAVLAAALVLPRFVDAPELEENRKLAPALQAPHDLASLQAWPHAVDAYVADHFPARPHLIGALNLLRLKLGVSGSTSVIVGRDGWLYYDNGSHLGAARNRPVVSDDQVRRWLETLAGRTEALRAQGAAYLVLIAPDKETVYPQHGPAWYRGPDPNRAALLLPRLAGAARAGEALYVHDPIARQARWGLKTYVPDETHWTGLGAWLGYGALMRRLQALGAVQEGPRPLESFAEYHDDDAFKPRNLALMLGVASFQPVDFPEFVDPTDARRLKVTYLTARRDWTAPRIIDTGRAGKPVLLITADSFSSALMPFLTDHFSRIVFAHNLDGAFRPDLVARFHPSVVILETLESSLPSVMGAGPTPSADARQRIAAALAAPHRERPDAFNGKALRLHGGPGPDRIVGAAGADLIEGRGGADTLSGGFGADHIRGGQGPDLIDGGPGDDWLSGDRGDDTLTGGPGADTFHSFAGAGLDLVTDFSAAEGDHVELEPGTAYDLRQEGADTVVEMAGARLVLRNVRLAELPTGWLVIGPAR